MRFGLERFAELVEQAAAEGWPPGWRMEHDAREKPTDRRFWPVGYTGFCGFSPMAG